MLSSMHKAIKARMGKHLHPEMGDPHVHEESGIEGEEGILPHHGTGPEGKEEELAAHEMDVIESGHHGSPESMEGEEMKHPIHQHIQHDDGHEEGDPNHGGEDEGHLEAHAKHRLHEGHLGHSDSDKEDEFSMYDKAFGHAEASDAPSPKRSLGEKMRSYMSDKLKEHMEDKKMDQGKMKKTMGHKKFY